MNGKQAFESHEVTVSISFRMALETIEAIAKNSFVDGSYFCERDAAILAQASANIRDKLREVREKEGT